MEWSLFRTVYLIVSLLNSAALIWDKQGGTYEVKPGETVRFHFANIGAFAFFHIWVEKHSMTVVEVDGVEVEPYSTRGISLAVGQRMSVLITMNQDPTKNYPLVAAMGRSLSDEPNYRSKHV